LITVNVQYNSTTCSPTMANYTASASITLLQSILDPLRIGLKSSDEDPALPADAYGISYLVTNPEAYLWNAMVLPIIVAGSWFITVISIWLIRKNRCFFNRKKCCSLGGTRTTNDGFGEESYSGEIDEVTIISDKDFLVRGKVEDKVRYIKLKKQTRIIRDIFSFLSIVIIAVSIPACVMVGNLYHTLSIIIKETSEITSSLRVSEAAMMTMIEDRDNILSTNQKIIESIDSSSQEGCFYDDYLSSNADTLSKALASINTNSDLEELQSYQDLFFTAGSFSNEVHSNIRWLSPILLTTFITLSLLLLSSLSMLIGSFIARQNNLKPWHRVVFHHIFSLMYFISSSTLWLSIICLVLIATPLVDFCNSSEGPIEAILSILRAKGFDESTLFYSKAQEYMTHECDDYLNMIGSIYNDFGLAAGGVAALLRLQGENSCSSFSSLSAHLTEFGNTLDQLEPNFETATYCSNCDEMYGWYSNISINQTCSKSPTLLTNSLMLICILAILSVGLTSLGIVWKTDMQLFLEISGVSDIDDEESFDEESFNEESTKAKTLHRLTSVRFQKKQSKQADFSVITEGQDLKKEESEKKIKLWEKLLKKSQRGKKMTKHGDVLQKGLGSGDPRHNGLVEDRAEKNILRQVEWSRGNMATPDNPVHRGEVEIVANFSNDNSKAYWKDSRDFSQSTDLDDNSLLAEAIGLAEEEHDKNMIRSRGGEEFVRDAEPSTPYHDRRARFDHQKVQNEDIEGYETAKKPMEESYAGQKHPQQTQLESFYEDESQFQYANQRTFGAPMDLNNSHYSRNTSHLYAEHPSYKGSNHLSPTTPSYPLHSNRSDNNGTSSYFGDPSYEARNDSSPALKPHHPNDYGNSVPSTSHIEQSLHSNRNHEPPELPQQSFIQIQKNEVEEKKEDNSGRRQKSILKVKSHGNRKHTRKKKSTKVKKSKKKILSMSSLDFSDSSDGSYNSEYYTDNSSALFDESFETSYESNNSSYYSDTTDEDSRRKRRKDSSRRNRSRSRNSRNRSRSRSSRGKNRRRGGTKDRSSSRKRSARRSSHR